MATEIVSPQPGGNASEGVTAGTKTPVWIINATRPSQGVGDVICEDRTVLSNKVINPALYVTNERKIMVAPAPILDPKPDEVLLHVKVTGICGSDVHLWKSGGIGPQRVESTYILGHETAGVVVKLGSNVRDFKVGDRVAVEPQMPCDQCYLCREGRHNLCQGVAFSGVYPTNGSLQRFKTHAAKWLHKIPDTISYTQAALLEPLSVILHAINQSKLSVGKGVSIHGAGPIGLVALVAARASGAYPISITDIEPGRLEFAKKLVPTVFTYQSQRDAIPEENAINIRKLFGAGVPSQVAVTENEYSAPITCLECTGIESSVATAAYTCRRGGSVMVIGVGKSTMNNVPFMHFSLSEVRCPVVCIISTHYAQIDLKFINRYRDTWPAGIQAMKGGIINLDALVTHTFPLEQADEALTLASDPSKGSIKVHVVDDVDVQIVGL
ncbi:MAG: hypothetical protein GOMPHAMPRED_003496 [Gomphillus americanus]|uniref:Enoyl reductase (ER) domain-containing protein n=1 Tax=Gomphillus americanus TaxID=1940652 RepID=A0A8H3IM16_9LECA|nr:MAG: hypothetical protein GOMPHAMPRED_003496 [Gomphillus americanus]